MLKSIRSGFAEGIDFRIMTTEIIKEKLQKVLEDPKYADNAKKLSARFRDQKEKPLDRAVWWIEWLLRNPNADFLKSPVLRLGFFTANSFDLIVLITIISLTVFFILIKLFVLYTRQIFQDKNQSANHPKDE